MRPTVSSWGCQSISQYYDIKNFQEPVRRPEQMTQLQDSLKSNETNLVVKIIRDQIQ